jgi:hypothetical protein
MAAMAMGLEEARRVLDEKPWVEVHLTEQVIAFSLSAAGP